MSHLPPIESIRPHHIVHIGGQGLRKVIQDNSTWVFRVWNLWKLIRRQRDRRVLLQWQDSALRMVRNIQNQEGWYGMQANQLISPREFWKLNKIVKILNRIRW